MNRFLTGLCVFAGCFLALLLVITIMQPGLGSSDSADLPSLPEDRTWPEVEAEANADELTTEDELVESSAVAYPLPPTMDEMSAKAQKLWGEEEKRMEREGRGPGARSDDRHRPQINRGSSVSAWVAAKAFVEDYLHCPSTAKYPWVASFDVAKYRGGRWYVKSYVDAENLFGAKVRTHFHVVVSTRDDRNWTLHSLKTD